MNWVLFVLVLGQDAGRTPAVTTAVFHTEAGCRTAADAAAFSFERYARTVQAFCTPNNLPPG